MSAATTATPGWTRATSMARSPNSAPARSTIRGALVAALATISAAAFAATSPTSGAASADVHGGGAFSTDFDVRTQVILANLYYDFRPYERLTPYIGIGVGAAHHSSSGGAIVTCGGGCLPYDGDSNWSAAGALMAGISFRIDRGEPAPVSIKDGPVYSEPGRLHLDVGYRFIYMGDAHTGNLIGAAVPTPGPRLDDITAHEIRVGLRWDFRYGA